MTTDYPYIQKTLDTITPISADMGGWISESVWCAVGVAVRHI